MKRELREYVENRGAPQWRRTGEFELKLTTPVWQDASWEHSVTIDLRGSETAILVITGGDPNELDLEEQKNLADLSNLSVCTLFHIPNQPLYELMEDDLIAHTFERFLEEGGSDWPLLFPMTRSVFLAMDAIEQFTNGAIKRFVVTGLSKRGWTSWLAGAMGDPRVVGIAPMVFDQLNFQAQLAHQLDTWGHYSESIASYTDSGLADLAADESTRQLQELVDPFEYREEMTVPTLAVHGTNDPFWQVDATSQYWDRLTQPKWLSVVPNVEHILGDKKQKLATLSAFSRAMAGLAKLPEIGPSLRVEKDGVFALAPGARRIQIWKAVGDNYDFREARWDVVASGVDAAIASSERSQTTAYLALGTYRMGDLEYALTSQVIVCRSPQR